MGQKQDAKPWSDPSGRPSLGKFNLFRSYNEILFSPPRGSNDTAAIPPPSPHINNNAANVSVPGWGRGTAPAAHKNRSR